MSSSLSEAPPAVFFDRDGVLNRDDGYVHSFQALRWMPGAIAAVRRFNMAGWRVFVVTNQSGVARGYFGTAAVETLHLHMSEALAEHAAKVDDWRYAPHHPQAVDPRWRHPDPPWRKPNPGMILDLLDHWAVDRARSVLIGDQPSDMEAARRAGLRGVCFRGGDLDDVAAEVLAYDEAQTSESRYSP